MAPRQAGLSDGDHIDFDVFGERGPFDFLGPQLYLTPLSSPLMGDMDAITKEYVDALSYRYRVILADWPRGMGKSSPPKAHTLRKDHAIRDLHAIADAAGAETFAWWGYSFGSAIGLQLARNNARITALVCAGFPPVFQPLSDMLGLVRSFERKGIPAAAQGEQDFAGMNRQSIAFYESVAGQDDWEAAGDITCPRLVLHDVNDATDYLAIKVDLAERTRAVEDELKAAGWEVAWIDTGKAHFAMNEAKAMLAAFVPFLDRVLLTPTAERGRQ